MMMFPLEILGERIVLRRPTPQHAPLVLGALEESRQELRKWLHWANTPHDLEKCLENIVTSNELFEAKQAFRYYIFDHDNYFLGSIGLLRIRWDIPSMEMGFWIRLSKTNHGICKEATHLLTKFALHHCSAKRIEIRCDEQNFASRKVAESCGYELEGILRHDSLTPEGQLRNTAVYSCIRL